MIMVNPPAVIASGTFSRDPVVWESWLEDTHDMHDFVADMRQQPA